MINRAGKKLFLNAMVGETIADADDRMYVALHYQ
jgi:hypothetical protein